MLGSVVGVIVGRARELGMIMAALDAARAGSGTVLCFDGDAGIGKSSLLAEAVALAPDFQVMRTVGVPTAATMNLAGVADLVMPLQHLLDTVPPAHRTVLQAILGRTEATTTRYQVAAG